MRHWRQYRILRVHPKSLDGVLFPVYGRADDPGPHFVRRHPRGFKCTCMIPDGETACAHIDAVRGLLQRRKSA